jgi:putative oxidoreductase
MTITRAIARPMLAGMFIYGGLDAVRNPESKAAAAEDVALALADPLGLPADTASLVRLNGGVQVAGGALLALGKFPRLASIVLASSLVPTTYAGHRFWEETDQARRRQQQIHFLKNMGIFGGLIMAATDTGGRPSVTWRARRALKRTSKASLAAKTSMAANAASVASHGAATLTSDASRAAAAGASMAAAGASLLGRRAARASKRAALAGKQATLAGRQATLAGRKASRQAADVTRRTAKDAAADATKAAKRASAVAAEAGEAAAERVRGAVERAREAMPVAG